MTALSWWMRIVGTFYGILFVGNVFLQAAPDFWLTEAVRVQTPDEALRLLVDTWVLFGLYQGVIAAALLIYSRQPERAMPVFWMVIGFEVFGGIVHDFYMLTHGHEGAMLLGLFVWIAIHSVIIATGLLALRRETSSATESASSSATA